MKPRDLVMYELLISLALPFFINDAQGGEAPADLKDNEA